MYNNYNGNEAILGDTEDKGTVFTLFSFSQEKKSDAPLATIADDDIVREVEDEANSYKTHWDTSSVDSQYFSGDWLPVYFYIEDRISAGEYKENKIKRNIELYEIKNILEKSGDNVIEVYKIGLQGKPGTVFTLDGAELRIGPTGIYQIEYPDLKIQEIGIVPFNRKEDKIQNNFFILDYKYNLIPITQKGDN